MIKIYTLSCPITKEIRYVGKTSLSLKARLNAHCQLQKESNHRYYWIRSIVIQNMKPIIELVEEVSDDNWQFWERWYIALFKYWGFNLVNDSLGGEGFERNHIPWNKGKTGIHTEETLKKLSILQKGKKLNSEIKHKISESLKNRKKPKRSHEHSNNISKSNMGRIAWNKGLVLDSSQKRKATKVIQKDLNNNILFIWDSVKDITLTISKGNIRTVCVGKRKMAGGFIWEYLKQVIENDSDIPSLIEKVKEMLIYFKLL